ncbi:hypothetical protein [Desertivirga xinjiangensis]|uniref:hypothetical protein n=1 Tax=Desertivirga xinjiangensis TaxID=539206 RepID=UPI00210DD0F7|nr:hypothetical protein [Pedobacter xinjiangensis]
MMIGIGLNSCQKDKLTIPGNVGTVRFVSNAYTIENNTLDPLIVTLPFSLPIEEDAIVKISIDDQSTLLPGEYTITPAIPAGGLSINVPEGSTELSFKVSSLNNFDGERSLILKIESAAGGLSVANVDASTSITVKGNPIINPELRTSQTDIAFGSVTTNTTSESKNYVLTSVKLTADVVVTASENFEVSLDNVSFATTLTIPFATANLSPISIYARAVANTGTNQTLSGTITHVSGTLPVANINLSAVEYGNAAPGVLLKSENLNYTTPGALITASGGAWKGFSGIGSNPIQYISSGLTYTGYTSSNVGGALVMQNSKASSEDAGLDFPEQTSGVIYVAQMINIASAPTSADFFASLGNGAAGTTPAYYNRIYAKASGAQYSLGLSRNASTSPVYLATNLEYGKTYLVVTKYEFATNNSSMYVLSAGIPSAEPPVPSATSNGGAADPSSMTRIVIRQSTNTPLEATIDGYRIATSWKEAVGL